MKVSELTGALLDYWVARAEGLEHSPAMLPMRPGFVMVPFDSEDEEGPLRDYRAFEPSSNWADGGPIIEQHRISVIYTPNETYGSGEQAGVWFPPGWRARITDHPKAHSLVHAETALIAAMRCFLTSVYGKEVPNEG